MGKKAVMAVPSIEEIIIRAKYVVPFSKMVDVRVQLADELNPRGTWGIWGIASEGDSIILQQHLGESQANELYIATHEKELWKKIQGLKPSGPFRISLIGKQTSSNELEIEVTSTPVMYNLITQAHYVEFPEQDVQAIHHEATQRIKMLMVGILHGEELEAPATRAFSKVTKAKAELTRLGLDQFRIMLEDAETKIVRGDSSDAVKLCRSVIEQLLDKLMERSGIGKTNAFTHNLDRLLSRLLLDEFTLEFIKSEYRYVSCVVHDNFKPGPREARLALSITEDLATYLLQLLS